MRGIGGKSISANEQRKTFFRVAFARCRRPSASRRTRGPASAAGRNGQKEKPSEGAGSTRPAVKFESLETGNHKARDSRGAACRAGSAGPATRARIGDKGSARNNFTLRRMISPRVHVTPARPRMIAESRDRCAPLSRSLMLCRFLSLSILDSAVLGRVSSALSQAVET